MMGRLRLAGLLLIAIAVGVFLASAVVPAAEPPKPPSLDAVPGSETISDTAADPDGGAPWALRLYTSTSGAACSELGRLDHGTFGTIDQNGVFSPVPLEDGGTCGDLHAEPAVIAVNRYPETVRRPGRTVVFGQVAQNVTAITVTSAGGMATAASGAQGGFLAPMEGDDLVSALSVTITFDDKTTHTYRFTRLP